MTAEVPKKTFMARNPDIAAGILGNTPVVVKGHYIVPKSVKPRERDVATEVARGLLSDTVVIPAIENKGDFGAATASAV